MLDTPTQLASRSRGIDSLRAVFAFWVVLAHVALWAPAVQGAAAMPALIVAVMGGLVKLFQSSGETHPAVVGFIVLSGYCIHRSGLRRRANDVRAYGVRRVFRIVPVYVLGTAVGLAGFLLSSAVAPTWAAALSGTAAVTPELVAAKLFAIAPVAPPLFAPTFEGNAPLHTVMVEMWLYALYPLLLVVIARRAGERALWILLGLAWLGGVVAITLRPELQAWWHNGSALGFLLYWWIGAKLVDDRARAVLARYWAPLVGAWAVLTFVLVSGLASGPLAFEGRKLIFAAVVGLVIARVDRVDHGLLAIPATVGRAGYSLYALHAPLAYSLIIAGAAWWIVIATAILVGLVSFRVYESPWQRLGRRLARGSADSTTSKDLSLPPEAMPVRGRV